MGIYLVFLKGHPNARKEENEKSPHWKIFSSREGVIGRRGGRVLPGGMLT